MEPDSIAEDRPNRNRPVSLYLSANIGLGIAILIWALLNWRCDEPLRFVSFCAAAVIASVLKIRLPGVTGTTSVSALFVLIGIAALSLPEALVIGASSMLMQCTWRPKSKPQPVQVAFNVCTLAIAICSTALVYNYTRAHTFELVALGVLALVYFGINSFLVACIISLTERKPLLTIWNGNQWALAYYFVGASMTFLVGRVPQAIQWELPFICLPLVYLVHRSNRTYVVQIENKKNYVQKMNAVHLRSIETLALAIDAKDHTTHDHLQRVQFYAEEIGKDLKLSDLEMEALRAAAVLHDIGKLAVPEHIISKPGKLTRAEFEKMKIHPVVGAEILERVEFPYPVVPIVRTHHEKWDGSGYPDGLKGEEIPIGSRILAVVDCLDALASDRQYRKALPLDEAMAKVASEAGTSFDPAVVRALQARYMELEATIRAMKPVEQPGLSKDIKITRGAAPAAGFATEDGPTDIDQIVSFQAALRNPNESERARPAFQAPSFEASSLRLREFLSVVALRLEDVVPFDAIAFYFRHGDVLRAEFAGGEDHRRLAALRIPAGEGLVGWVAEVGKTIVNGNPAVEPGYLEVKGAAPALNSAIALPFSNGVLAVYRSAKDAFTSQDLSALLAASKTLGDIRDFDTVSATVARTF